MENIPVVKQLASEILTYEICEPEITSRVVGKTKGDELIAKTYRIPKNTVNNFASVCKERGEKSVGSVLDNLMRSYVSTKPLDNQLLMLTEITSKIMELMVSWASNNLDGDEYSNKIIEIINDSEGKLDEEHYKSFLNIVITARNAVEGR